MSPGEESVDYPNIIKNNWETKNPLGKISRIY